MAVSTGSELLSINNKTRALGVKAINADFAFEIEGFEHIWLLAKQCPWPELSTAGEIEVATPLGGAYNQPQQTKSWMQGAITLYETESGAVDQILLNLLIHPNRAEGFTAKIYQGTPDDYSHYKIVRNAFLQMDTPDRDWENRSQILMFNGTLFYHYFGETVWA